jgi:4-hydroxy-tetrahydrodipicolinate reductase
MKLCVIGHGAMGTLVQRLATEAGNEVAIAPSLRDAERSVPALVDIIKGHDVAIDFSVAGAVKTNVLACMEAGVPLVEGATGWREQEEEIRRLVEEKEGAFVYGANFSVGVNLFYLIATEAAKLFGPIMEYDVFIEEAHHKRKRDAPSGTALVLKALAEKTSGRDVPVSSTRAGYIPGTHTIVFDSVADQITLTHTARSREGFARGAILAAEWIKGRKGFYEFSQVLNQMLDVGC